MCSGRFVCLIDVADVLGADVAKFTELLEADIASTFMTQSAATTTERPERRTRSAELQTDETRRKSSTGKGKKTTHHRDRNRSPAQVTPRTVNVELILL